MQFNLNLLRLWFVSFLCLFSIIVSAQQRTITGSVTDNNNQPVVGASVIVRGTNFGTITDEQGRYTITIPNDQSTLIVSYVGYETRELNVRGQSTVDISLGSTGSTLNEVVITGYTSQARKDISGSVAVVNAADLKSVPSANAEQQLQGRASGVTVVSSGVPGAGASVRIRGFASFGGNEPLYIVDGVPVGGIGGINPNDIESMQVLKDAASASIYGARASNGVIIVTTKKGKQGGAKVSYNAYYGRQDPGKGFTNLLNPQEMADLTWMAYKNAGQTPPTIYGTGNKPRLPDYTLPTGAMEGDSSVNPALYNLDLTNIPGSYLITKANKQGTDWYDVLTDNAPIMNHNIALSGGADRSRYLFSFDYFDQKGIVAFNFFKRYTARLNTEFSIKDNIRIGENVQFSVTQDNGVGNNNEGTDIAMAFRIQPIIPVYDIMGNFAGTRGQGLGNASNPYANRFRARHNRGNSTSILGNMYAEVDFFRMFTVRSSIGGQINNGNYYFFSPMTYERSENQLGNSFTEGFNRFRSWTWTNLLTFRNNFNGVHDLTAIVGTEAVEDWGRNIEGTRTGYFTENPDFRSLRTGGAAGQRVSGAPFTPSALFSYFGKADYTFRDKYLASVTVRRDGSSRFGPENRWATFPAVSIGWRISQESFMEGINWLSDLKLRASYGKMGNQRINSANAFSTFGSGSGSSNYAINGQNTSTDQGFQALFIGNPAGKWETNITKNVGLDASLFGGRTELIAEYYIKDTRDLLYQLPQPGVSGAAAGVNRAFYNVASMTNKGFDLSLTQRTGFGTNLRNRVSLDATLTFTSYNNKITSIAEEQGIEFYDAGGLRHGTIVRNQAGQPMSSFYGYQVVGLFQSEQDVTNSPTQAGAAPGRFKYLDANGDKMIDAADRVFFGNPHPDFSYGLNLNTGFRNFDFTLFFYGLQGRDLINYTRWFTDLFASFPGAKSKDALYNSWTPQNTGARTPIAENVSNFSTSATPNSYLLEDASYLRLKNLTLGYSLPTNISNRVKIDRLRIYIQGTNLFTATKYTGLDPEVIGSDDQFGIDAGAYPTVKQFLIGLNVNF